MLSEFSDQTCRQIEWEIWWLWNSSGSLSEFLWNSSRILLEFSRNSSKIQIGIPIRKSAGFPNMFCFTYKYSFSTCLVNVSCRWCIALWFEKISWPASNNCPFSWCCWKKMKIKIYKMRPKVKTFSEINALWTT